MRTNDFDGKSIMDVGRELSRIAKRDGKVARTERSQLFPFRIALYEGTIIDILNSYTILASDPKRFRDRLDEADIPFIDVEHIFCESKGKLAVLAICIFYDCAKR